jgi:hypothetical protein
MSYNVHVFQKFSQWWKKEGRSEIRDMKAWIGNSGADVLCMPEYYDEDETIFDSGIICGKRDTGMLPISTGESLESRTGGWQSFRNIPS